MIRIFSSLTLIVAVTVGFFAVFGEQPQKPLLFVERGHNAGIRSLAVSPDGKLLASGGDDKTIRVWDVASGIELISLKGHVNEINAVAFDPTGRLLATGSADKSVRLWNVEKGTLIRSMTGHTSEVTAVLFSRNGKWIASTSGDESLRLWDVESGRELHNLEDPTFTSGGISSLSISRDGTRAVTAGKKGSLQFWDLDSLRIVKTLFKPESASSPTLESLVSFVPVQFSPTENLVAVGRSLIESEKSIRLLDADTGSEKKRLNVSTTVNALAFSPNGKTIATGGVGEIVRMWDVSRGSETGSINSGLERVSSVVFSQDGKTLFTAGEGNSVRLWDVATGRELRTLKGHSDSGGGAHLTPDGMLVAGANGSISRWNLQKSGRPETFKGQFWAVSPNGESIAYNESDQSKPDLFLRSPIGLPIKLIGSDNLITAVSFSAAGDAVAAADEDNNIKIWNTANGKLSRTLRGHDDLVWGIAFSADGKSLASTSMDETVRLWDVASGRERTAVDIAISSTEFSLGFSSIVYSDDGKMLACGSPDGTIRILDGQNAAEKAKLVIKTTENNPARNSIHDIPSTDALSFSHDGKLIASGSSDNLIRIWNIETESLAQVLTGHSGTITSVDFNNDGTRLLSSAQDGTIRFWDLRNQNEIVQVIPYDDDWFILTPDGRFDTNKSLDYIPGVHWILESEILRPIPLESYMRQYYEPNLLPRILKCTGDNTCDKEFKPLPSIAEINRVQPNVRIKDVRSAAGLADVTLEVENVSAEIGTEKKQLSSGVYDLRLFRDGQLVGVSTPKEKLEKFIADAPRLVAETKASGKLVDTPEDRAWREANDLFRIKADNVKQIAPGKLEYTFRNVKLPRDGRDEVSFTAYAFNSDKVKSATTEPFKFAVPRTVSAEKKKEKAVVVSVGVNASENPAYRLRYAANDARKMQEVVAARLKADSAKYSEVVEIPLISDYAENGALTDNAAQKAIIKGVFSLLAGNRGEVPPEILSQIPNSEKIKPIEPEDTLLIAFSGHGYTDQSGIFYLLPYDIGKDTTKLTGEALRKTISSDELSLWMQDITAAEMMMIIDACHSSAAVQGDGFKPGPMGSRGLGQLAYDKDMKILSATQADNVALELGSLKQGLLSYALIQDGIVEAKADADKDKQLLPAEWLSYAEKRVPELYQEVRDGKRGVILDGKTVNAKTTTVVSIDENQTSNLNLQQPSLFDFKRRLRKDQFLRLVP